MRRIGLLGGTFDPVHRGHVDLARLARERLRLERVLLAPAGVQPLKSGEVPGASWEERLRMVTLAVEGVAGLEASAVDAPRESGRPNYSAETVERLAEELAGDGDATEIIFLMGADAFAGFRRWHDPEGLMRRADLAVVSRPRYELPREGLEVAKLMPEGAKFLGKEELGGGDGEDGAEERGGGEQERSGEKRRDGERERSGEGRGISGMSEEANSEALVYLCGSALVRVYVLKEMAEDIAATALRAELAQGRGWEWLDPRVAEYVRARGLYGS
jgi:nicotinate (nicotinamide) nucleotide adenylyltransferase